MAGGRPVLQKTAGVWSSSSADCCTTAAVDLHFDEVYTSDLSRRLPDVENEGTISQPSGQCRDQEINVDPYVGTQCESPESVELEKESQVSPVSPNLNLQSSARNRKPPTNLGDELKTVEEGRSVMNVIVMKHSYQKPLFDKFGESGLSSLFLSRKTAAQDLQDLVFVVEWTMSNQL